MSIYLERELEFRKASLVIKVLRAFNKENNNQHSSCNPKEGLRQGAITWQILSLIAYLAKDKEGKEIFKGCCSIAEAEGLQTLLLATREAVSQARRQGYKEILLLSSSKQLQDVLSGRYNPNWKNSVIVEDSQQCQSARMME
nr:hypothetical protein CFP56_08287 [Quercus suber]